MQKKSTSSSAFFTPRALLILLLCAAACLTATGTLLAFLRAEAPANISQRTLTFAERVAYQRAIEDVYWRHRIWPKEHPDAKPSLDAVMSQAQLEKKVANYLRKSQALEDYWQRPLTAEQLQTEMDRMAQHTKQPEVLRELFETLGNDPFVIAECLARPVLAERLLTEFYAHDRRFDSESKRSWLGNAETQVPVTMAAVNANYTLPVIASPSGGCTDDTWTPTSLTNAPDPRYDHTAVWTGSEMIIWGGTTGVGSYFNTGGRYNPATDSWTATSTANAPRARYYHTAVWTGSEMIVWGGFNSLDPSPFLNTGGRYNPSTDSWTATSTINAPDGRQWHTAVWTGSEMIVWGGYFYDFINGVPRHLNTGGRYNPSTNSWTATSTTNAPAGREQHTAVWTGKMIVWGGYGINYFDTGGIYNPSTDSWTATSTTGAPSARFIHTAVWTGSQMIVWGGANPNPLQTGGRYDPNSDGWAATSTTGAPEQRISHTAVSTGSEMIVWGGADFSSFLNTGGRYNPNNDSWTGTSLTDAPSGREAHTAVWIDSEMIVWGGAVPNNYFNTGGRYCAAAQTPTPTSTPMATATPTPTPTPTATTTPTATATASPTPTPTPTPTATSTPTITPIPTSTPTPTPTPRPTPSPRSSPLPRSRPTPPPRPMLLAR